MAVPPTPVAAAPEVPDRAQRATFSARATAFFDWIKNTFVAGVNALASNVYANAQDAASSAANAVAQSASATAQAGIATAQAAAATSAAATATTQAGVATTQAASITTAAATSTAKADVATAKAAEATAAAATATAVTLGVSTGHPQIRPTLLLDFVNSRSVDPRITFTRSSTATYFDAQGVLRTAASDVPRIDHDPVTGECKGLLIEEARTNLLTYSEQFDNTAAWYITRSSITVNAVTAPDGTLTADKLVENTDTSSSHYLYCRVNVTAGTTYTLSFYVKAAERTNVALQFWPNNAAFAYSNAFFNIGTGVITNSAQVDSATIAPIGNGWHRISATKTATSTALATISVALVSTGTTIDYTGDGTSGIYVWGAQLEAGTIQTSYIPTGASQATRAAEAAVMTGTNFSSWYRADEGAFVASFDSQGSTNRDNDASVLCVSNPSANYFPAIALMVNDVSSINRLNGVVYNDAGTSQLSGVYGANNSYTFGAVTVAAIAYKTNDVQLAQAGSTIGTNDTSVQLGTNLDRLYIGNFYAPTNRPINGHIRRIAYYPKRLTNAELQALTA